MRHWLAAYTEDFIQTRGVTPMMMVVQSAIIGDGGRRFRTIGNQGSTRSILSHSIKNAEGNDNLVEFPIPE